MKQFLSKLRNEFNDELLNIADWWIDNAIDTKNGGYFGEISHTCNPISDADKGLVLNARILWFFSEAAQRIDDDRYKQAAVRAFEFIESYFKDSVNRGYWWRLNHLGDPTSTRKQVYGQAFIIYAYSSYYTLTQNKGVLDRCFEQFEILEKHAKDQVFGGYWEAFAENWSPIDDVRLSPKDLNCSKTMNTHLHVLEAYTTLYKVSADKVVGTALSDLLTVFNDKVIDHTTSHLKMFLDAQWVDHSEAFSYGHDIEASWLMWEAAEALGTATALNEIRSSVISLANTCVSDAIAENGGVIDEYLLKERLARQVFPWWVQAEALVGFLNAYELTKDEIYLFAIEKIWKFIQDNQIDKKSGEWNWFSKVCSLKDHSNSDSTYKAGQWKGPYHNGRAMIELITRIDRLTATVNQPVLEMNYV